MRRQIFRILNARIKIMRNKYPPQFNPNEWSTYGRANCYMYALNLHMNQSLLVGDFINKRITPSNISELMKTLILELNLLGFRLAKPGEKNYMEIGIHINRANMYHLIRKDMDGEWSDKMCGTMPQKILLSDLDEGFFEVLKLKKR